MQTLKNTFPSPKAGLADIRGRELCSRVTTPVCPPLTRRTFTGSGNSRNLAAITGGPVAAYALSRFGARLKDHVRRLCLARSHLLRALCEDADRLLFLVIAFII